MARKAPPGWKLVDRYHMTRGDQSICRIWIGGVMKWELWRGSFPKTSQCLLRCDDADDGFAKCVELADELKEAA